MSKTDGTGSAHPYFTSPTVAPAKRPRRLVRVRAIGPRRFRVDDRAIPEGEIVTVDDYVADDLVAVGKAERLA